MVEVPQSIQCNHKTHFELYEYTLGWVIDFDVFFYQTWTDKHHLRFLFQDVDW